MTKDVSYYVDRGDRKRILPLGTSNQLVIESPQYYEKLDNIVVRPCATLCQWQVTMSNTLLGQEYAICA